MLVSKKKKAVTLGLPPEIADALDQVTGLVNGKQKWLVFSSSVLLFLDSPEDVQRTLMARVASAEIGMGAYEELIAKARAGELRSDVEKSVAPSGRPQSSKRPSRPTSAVAGQQQSQSQG